MEHIEQHLIDGYATVLAQLDSTDQARFEQAFIDLQDIAMKIQRKSRAEGE